MSNAKSSICFVNRPRQAQSVCPLLGGIRAAFLGQTSNILFDLAFGRSVFREADNASSHLELLSAAGFVVFHAKKTPFDLGGGVGGDGALAPTTKNPLDKSPETVYNI